MPENNRHQPEAGDCTNLKILQEMLLKDVPMNGASQEKLHPYSSAG